MGCLEVGLAVVFSFLLVEGFGINNKTNRRVCGLFLMVYQKEVRARRALISIGIR